MKRVLLLPSAYLLDAVAGDPEWLPHPVRAMGCVIARGEKILRAPGRSPLADLAAGAALTIALVGCTYSVTSYLLRRTQHISPLLSDSLELVLAWTCLAARNLHDEAAAVTGALDQHNLPLARTRLARIVGRDTAALDEPEICRAVIETVAESVSDGVVAPLFYLALGGVPLAMAYKAVNTLDSMIGHADDRYFYFGKAAARLDDLANLLPSRITAAAITASAQVLPGCDAARAMHTWQHDGSKHKSPNAGQPESAIAGALGVRLGGNNSYAGEIIRTPFLGAGFASADVEAARRSLRVAAVAGLLTLAAATLACVIVASRRRR